MVIFLHIPKTGGTSLVHLLRKKYEDFRVVESIEEVKSLPQNISGFSGHISIDVQNYIPKQSTIRFISILRDPLDRLLSLYSHILHDTSHKVYRKILSQYPEIMELYKSWSGCAGVVKHTAEAIYRKMPIDQFVTSGLTKETDNGQTRILSGIEATFGECTDKMIRKSIENIDNRIAWISTVNRIELMLPKLSEMLNWNGYEIEVRNKRKTQFTIPPVSNDQKRTIEKFNSLDYLLYQYVSRKIM